ncbi:MAG: hypothetical protein U5L01_09645, partial [Rheinheimera sp.]|nr:hypothetical protein [Rheinheimera sp.]
LLRIAALSFRIKSSLREFGKVAPYSITPTLLKAPSKQESVMWQALAEQISAEIQQDFSY